VSSESKESDGTLAGDNLIDVGIAANTRPVPRVTANKLSLVMIDLPVERIAPRNRFRPIGLVPGTSRILSRRGRLAMTPQTNAVAGGSLLTQCAARAAEGQFFLTEFAYAGFDIARRRDTASADINSVLRIPKEGICVHVLSALPP
jgi:hypothetical protein